MCIALMIDPRGDPDIIKAQEKFRATLEDWIPKILAAQEPDGYLQTAFTARPPNSRWTEHWSPAFRGYWARMKLLDFPDRLRHSMP